MKRILVLALIVIAFACNKDKFQTKPQIRITSYNTKEVVQGQTLQISIEYTDQEGDLAAGNFFTVRERLNAEPLPPDNDKVDTLRYPITSFPERQQAELLMQLDYGFLKEHPSINDTIRFRIAVEDVAGNKSDTITTDNIVIVR